MVGNVTVKVKGSLNRPVDPGDESMFFTAKDDTGEHNGFFGSKSYDLKVVSPQLVRDMEAFLQEHGPEPGRGGLPTTVDVEMRITLKP